MSVNAEHEQNRTCYLAIVLIPDTYYLILPLPLFQQLISNQRSNVSHGSHISQLDNRPLPALGFTVNNRNRTHALHCKSIKKH